jgi:hypothetical protein
MRPPYWHGGGCDRLCGVHDAGDRLVGREFAQVGQDEQRLGADYDREVTLQLAECVWVTMAALVRCF